MCVIAISENVRLTDEQVQQMWDNNPRGGGAAWRAVREDGMRVVRWKKGLNITEMKDLNSTLPLPYVLHFRIPSHGTATSWLACHPFQIDADAAVGFEGETEGYVLFHNGFWIDWKNKIQQIALTGYVKVPSGPWSDSRGLAWAAHHLGLGFLDMVDEKVVAFGPNDEDTELFGSWQHINNVSPETGKEERVIVSNKTWDKPVVQMYRSPYDRTRDTLDAAHKALNPASNEHDDEETGGTPHLGTFPVRNGILAGETGDEENQQESIPQTCKGLVPLNAALACVTCRKTTAQGIHVDYKYYCYQCWPAKPKPRVSQCQFCHASIAGAKTFFDDKWMCKTCYEVNGRPRVYFGEKREDVIDGYPA